MGKSKENDQIWNGLDIEQFDGNYDQIGLVVYPTYIEHQPRQVLKAIAKGIPVITTSACGLESSSQVSVIAFNDFERLKNEVSLILSK
jgi:glycosyltransferase involved in cell wall biosynthesis